MTRAQDDLVTVAQLHALGLGRSAVAHRVRHGWLHPALPTVYTTGNGALTPRGSIVAALLWAGDDAVVSHGSAAWVWGLIERPPAVPVLTVIARNRKSRPEVRVHRSLTLERQDIRMRHGLPVTVPALTLLDYASETGDDGVDDALAAARLARLATDTELDEVVARHPRRPGLPALRRALARQGGATITRSEAERRFLRLVADAELPRPEVNVQLGGMEVDFLWRPERLVVEVDGWRHHSGRVQREHDRWRDQRLTALGLRVIRVTWRQLTRTPVAVAARLAQALAGGGIGSPGTPGLAAVLRG